MIHRYYQVKKTYSQEINRLISTCDVYFPELQYVFEPKSAAFPAILSSYPTTQDIINASKSEVFDCAYEATKHRVTLDKIDMLFNYCNDTLTDFNISYTSRSIILDLAASVKRLKSLLKELEKKIKVQASMFDVYELLLTITGCGPITAATVIAETGDISRFHSADKFVS